MINLSNHTNKIRHVLFSSSSPERPSTNRIFNLDYLSRPYTKDVTMSQFPLYTFTLRPVCTVTFTSQGQLNNFLLSYVISTPTLLPNYRWS